MADISKIDYWCLDGPEVSMALFHPRPARYISDQDILIPAEEDVAIGARFYMTEKTAPNILFFHGNGEIVADYEDLGPMYNHHGINFLPVDYRGYGRSGGKPTVTAMMRDCHTIFDFVKKWLKDEGYAGSLTVMGRSLGSASAIELGSCYKDQIDSLIIESGFAYAAPLLELIGVSVHAIGFKEEEGFRNIDKIREVDKPTLIIHAEYDHIIPFSDGQALYEACSATDKTLLKILGANHNDILLRGLSEYMAAVRKLVGCCM